MIKLLLVDDERIIREGIEAMLPLERLGICLTGSCANAFDALDSMADDLPDILVTDVKMPRMDGLALIERALTLNPALQCVVLSGFDEFAFAQKAIKMGVREYLLKPCTKEEMAQSLDRLCREIKAARQRASDCLDDRAARTAELAAGLAALVPDERTRAISPDQVRALARATGEEPLLREAYTYLVTHQEAQAERGFAALQQAYDRGGEWAETIAQGLSRMQARPGQHRGFVNAMCAYIHEHYRDENLSLQYLADHVVHMRADYIGREFARDTGMKISAYLLRVRMEKAKTLLAAGTDEPHIYEVAEAVGLGHNPQYFSTLFRKYTGLNPKDYGRNQTKNNKN